jgi:hypothetical protein
LSRKNTNTKKKETNHTLAFHINLIPKEDERVLVVFKHISLDQEFPTPVLQVLECFHDGDIKDENATIGTSVE